MKQREEGKDKYEKKLARIIQGAAKIKKEEKKKQATQFNIKDQKHKREFRGLENNQGQAI